MACRNLLRYEGGVRDGDARVVSARCPMFSFLLRLVVIAGWWCRWCCWCWWFCRRGCCCSPALRAIEPSPVLFRCGAVRCGSTSCLAACDVLRHAAHAALSIARHHGSKWCYFSAVGGAALSVGSRLRCGMRSIAEAMQRKIFRMTLTLTPAVGRESASRVFLSSWEGRVHTNENGGCENIWTRYLRRHAWRRLHLARCREKRLRNLSEGIRYDHVTILGVQPTVASFP